MPEPETPKPPLTDLARELPASVPFVGPETLERRSGTPFTARLGANESVFGPAPTAIEAMARAAASGWKYGDPENHDLKAALAARLNVPATALTIGEGIDALLGYTVRLFAGQGDSVLTSDGAYPTFLYHVTGFGGQIHKIPYKDDREDLTGLAGAAQRLKPKLVYLANPDNPMGSWWPAADVQALIDALPAGTLLCLDEAYGEFAPEGTLPPLDPDDPRVIRFRTFSKAYGMAGLRIGYTIAHPQIAAAYNKVRLHFGVNRVAQAGALAALAAGDHLKSVLERTAAARTRIGAIAADHGLNALPSATNFVAIDGGRNDTFAKSLLEALGRRGIFVRMPGPAPLNRCIRITVGTEADLNRLAEAFGPALTEAAQDPPAVS